MGSANAQMLSTMYAPHAHLFDPAGGRPVAGKDAVAHHFASVLTEPREALRT